MKKLHTKKIGPSGAPGLASASPWRANVSQCRKTERGDPLRFFNIHSVAKHEKIEEIFFCFREKILQCRKKLKGGTLWDFPISILSQNIKKMQGDPLRKKNFEKKIPKKMSPVPKKIERGDSLVSPGMVCYAEKQVKPFWFSSLDQIVQFDTIIFCRTFKNYFGQFVWIEKKRVTIIVAFHFMKRRLKTLIDKIAYIYDLSLFERSRNRAIVRLQ